ncbi:MAG: hypothetical protein ABH843_03640 [Candidatus Omnitrophota bacterium]
MKKNILLYILILLVSSINMAQAQELEAPLYDFKKMVSENYGTIRDSYFAGNSQGIVIHIQDLHCNYDAQMSIYNILGELMDKYGVDLVTIEGVEGELDTAPFSSYPDIEIKERVAKYFVKTGELNGAALSHIMRESGFKFWGADDKIMHTDNVEAYKVSLREHQANTKYYNNMKAILEDFKAKVYPPELKELDDNIQAYKKEDIEFSEYVTYLNQAITTQGINSQDHKNLIKLTQVLKMEADIDFLEVDTQRAEYIDKLSEELKKNALSDLLDKSLHFKVGKIGALEFYKYIEAVSQGEGLTPIADYPQLTRYIEYIKLYSEIENIKLFDEIEGVESALKDKMFENDAQRTIDKLSKGLEVLNDLFNLKLTKETLQYYRDNRAGLATSNYINFISENAPKYGVKYDLDPSFRKIDATLPQLEKFYMLAEERDIMLIKNTLSRMKYEGSHIAALVSGGFHTEGITKFLKEKDLSYVVITPKVDKLQEDNPYKSVLLGEKNEFDKFYEMVLKTAKK